MSEQVPPVAVIIVHKVENWDKWKAAFDDHAGARKDAGVVGHQINRGVDDANMVAVYMPGSDGDRLKALLVGDDIKAKMQEAGVAGPPMVSFMTPVEDLTDKRDLPGAIIRHSVKDFDAWMAGYVAHKDMRRSSGIVGDAVNRSVENANEVVVYLQAESHDALKGFLESADLKEAMQKTGVEGAPDITLWNGSERTQY
jgi:hypothetical protein